MTQRPVHVVGAGIGGLVAAVTLAESGADVVVHEASERVGGRAIGATGRRGVNFGPHVVFVDGALVRWLRMHRVQVPLRPPVTRGVRLLDDSGTPHFPVAQSAALAGTLRRANAPVDISFREWAEGRFGTKRGALLCRFAGLFTFHHDPGSLSARFVWERYRRTFLHPHRVRWVGGGWSSISDALVQRALSLGVQVETGQRVSADTLPEGPTVVATPLQIASRLLRRPLRWPGSRTALLDVITHPCAGWPSVVADVRSDISTCCMLERETAFDRGLLGEPGAELFQAHLGIAPGTGAAEGVARIESVLDEAAEGWRERTIWQHGHVVSGSTGAVDPPGATWRDRPAVDQGDGLFLAGDSVASPGMLSEVSVNSAVRAAHLALEASRQRSYAPGWPRVALSPERRLEVLASALTGSSVVKATLPHDSAEADLEPVDETGPGYRLEVLGGLVAVGTAVTRGPAGATVTSLVSLSAPGSGRRHQMAVARATVSLLRWLSPSMRRRLGLHELRGSRSVRFSAWGHHGSR